MRCQAMQKSNFLCCDQGFSDWFVGWRIMALKFKHILSNWSISMSHQSKKSKMMNNRQFVKSYPCFSLDVKRSHIQKEYPQFVLEERAFLDIFAI